MIKYSKSRLHNIINHARKVHEENIAQGLYGPNQSRDAILIEALVELAQLIDDYIDAQPEASERETAYRVLFETVR